MRKSGDGPSAFGEGALPATAASNSAGGEDPWADWYRWCDGRADSRIEEALYVFAGMVGDEIGASVRELRDEIVAAFRKRDERIAALEGRFDALLGLLQAKGGAEIVTLPGRKHG
jgi:hypothetical protein